jgi:hypothetical protein
LYIFTEMVEETLGVDAFYLARSKGRLREDEVLFIRDEPAVTLGKVRHLGCAFGYDDLCE